MSLSSTSSVGRSVAYQTAQLKCQTKPQAEIDAFRASVLGNNYARRLMDVGTGYLEERPQGSRWDLGATFMQFDTDGDGVLDMGEFQRAFRAIGLTKRSGAKMEIDQKMFNAFDTNRDGRISVAEFEDNLFPKTRAKIEEKLDAGWKFDAKRWAASTARHQTWNMAKVFKQFDFDGDGYLTIAELKRAFRALGLKKRTGEKMNVDDKMFKEFDKVQARAMSTLRPWQRERELAHAEGVRVSRARRMATARCRPRSSRPGSTRRHAPRSRSGSTWAGSSTTPSGPQRLTQRSHRHSPRCPVPTDGAALCVAQVGAIDVPPRALGHGACLQSV